MDGLDQWNIIGLALGVAGLVMSYLFYIKAIVRKEPRYTRSVVQLGGHYRESNPVLAGLLERTDANVQLLRDIVPPGSIPIYDVCYITRLCFWNGGRQTIMSTDLTLELVADGPDALIAPAMLYTAGDGCGFTFTCLEEGRRYRIGFTYLDRGHGVMIEYIHQGPSSIAGHWSGYTIGGGEPKFVPTVLNREHFPYPGLSGQMVLLNRKWVPAKSHIFNESKFRVIEELRTSAGLRASAPVSSSPPGGR